MSIKVMGIGMVMLLVGAGVARAADQAPAPVRVQAGTDGFSFASADGSWKVRLYGVAQLDGRFVPADDAEAVTDSFLLRRMRPSLQVTVGKGFEATFVPDFGGGAAVIQDAHVDVIRSRAARFRAGKFKTPFSLEKLQSATWLPFVERSLTSGLTPSRDVGVQFQGESGPVLYAAALQNGAPADVDGNDAKDVAARLFVKPLWKSEGAWKALGFGVAITTGTQKGALPTQRTTAQAAFFQFATGTTADGNRFRLAPQASFTAGPVAGFAEYVVNDQAVVRGPSAEEVRLSAWTVTGAWLLTGEPASLGAIAPKRSFDPQKGGRGAWELKARVSGFAAEDAVFDGGYADPTRSARKALAVGVGLNWYLNRNVRSMFDYERTTFEGGAAGGDRAAENALLWRLQLAY